MGARHFTGGTIFRQEALERLAAQYPGEYDDVLASARDNDWSLVIRAFPR